MKILKLLLILFVLASCNQKEPFIRAKINPTEIDALQTDAQIEQYIAKHDSLYSKFTLAKVQDIACLGCDSLLKNLAKKLKINYSYIKADLDNNGYTDLVVTGVNKTYTGENTPPDMLVAFSKAFNAFVLMNFGQHNLKLHDLTDGLWYGLVPKVEVIDGRPRLVVYKPAIFKKSWKAIVAPESRTVLTYAFGDFVEYNPAPAAYNIEKIEFSTTGCMGECPIFSMKIEAGGHAVFDAGNYNYTQPWQQGVLLSGTYKAVLHEKDSEQLNKLLQYLDFPKLANNYKVQRSDDQSGILKITYNGGNVKTIDDYGMQGTYGLRLVYKIIHDMRLNQDWKLAPAPSQ